VSLLLKKLLIRTGLVQLFPGVQRLARGGESFLRYYSDRLLSAPHAELIRAGGYQHLHEPDGIDLSSGSPRFDLLPSASTRLPVDRRGHPPLSGLPELREAIADQLWTEHLVRVRATDEVQVTAGAAGALSLCLDAFVSPGHGVVLFDPCSPLYPLMLKPRRARLRWVPTWTESGRLRFRLDHLARAMRRARLIILCHPNNPTGAVFSPEDMEQICWWAHRHDVLVVHDTSFAAWQYDGPPCRPAASAYADKRVLTIGSVSKSHALASARVGWLAGPRPFVGVCAMTAASHTPFVATLCQQLALQALQLDPKELEPIRGDFQSRRQYTVDRLKTMGLEPVWPAGTFFLWVPVKHLGLNGDAFADRLRQEHKVLVWPGSFFGPSGQDHIRLSYAGDEGRLREGLSRLGEFVRQLQTPSAVSPPHHRLIFRRKRAAQDTGNAQAAKVG
jgi:aspartate/methionine/tyrosine aminotransferase